MNVNLSIFGRPFVKRYTLCYRTFVCPVLSCPVLCVCLSVCLSGYDVGVWWSNGWMDQDEIWHEGRSRSRSQCIRWGPNSPKKGHSPQFSAHAYCGQTAGWIKMPLGTEVGLDPGDIVLHGDPSPPQKGTQQPPLFGPCLL